MFRWLGLPARWDMVVNGRGSTALASAVALICSLAMALGARAADNKTYVMKITLATLNDAPHQFAKNLAAAVERDSGGRIKPEIYAESQLGSVQRQIEGV